jgi:hypothetical protein
MRWLFPGGQVELTSLAGLPDAFGPSVRKPFGWMDAKAELVA